MQLRVPGLRAWTLLFGLLGPWEPSYFGYLLRGENYRMGKGGRLDRLMVPLGHHKNPARWQCSRGSKPNKGLWILEGLRGGWGWIAPQALPSASEDSIVQRESFSAYPLRIVHDSLPRSQIMPLESSYLKGPKRYGSRYPNNEVSGTQKPLACNAWGPKILHARSPSFDLLTLSFVRQPELIKRLEARSAFRPKMHRGYCPHPTTCIFSSCHYYSNCYSYCCCCCYCCYCCYAY